MGGKTSLIPSGVFCLWDDGYILGMIKRILLLIFFSQIAFAQLDTLWTKTYFPDEDTLGFIGKSLF